MNTIASPYTLRSVQSAADERLFIDMIVDIYKDDPNYIRPLDKDIRDTFDPKKNKILAENEAERFLLFDANNKCVGRIAVFINKREAFKQTQPTGGLGFFECINDVVAANMLFDKAIEWLKARDMEAVDGPINIGERIRFWGLMVDGFTPPIYGLGYNPTYYRALFEQYGFENYHEQYCYGMTVEDRLSKSFYDRHARLKADPAYHAEMMDKSKLKKYAADFTEIYNKAWASHGSGKQLKLENVEKEFASFKDIVDPRISWFVYHENKPIAFWINLPNINEIFKHFNGKLGLWQKLRFLYMQRTGYIKSITAVAFGVVPEFQAKGVESFMIIESENMIRNAGYTSIELQWIHERNPKMIRVTQYLQATKKRTLITYRYLFDREKPFERHPIIGRE